MVKVHEFCLCGLKLSTFPKWLSAQVFQNDFLLNCSKVTICSHFQSDYLLKISMMTFCSILKLGLWKCPKVPPNIYIYILHALWGPKKWLKHTQNPSRMSFRVLIFPLVLAKKGPQWPPKGNPHNLESYYGSLNRIWLASERWHQNSIIRIMMLSFLTVCDPPESSLCAIWTCEGCFLG